MLDKAANSETTRWTRGASSADILVFHDKQSPPDRSSVIAFRCVNYGRIKMSIMKEEQIHSLKNSLDKSRKRVHHIRSSQKYCSFFSFKSRHNWHQQIRTVSFFGRNVHFVPCHSFLEVSFFLGKYSNGHGVIINWHILKKFCRICFKVSCVQIWQRIPMGRVPNCRSEIIDWYGRWFKSPKFMLVLLSITESIKYF